MIKQRRPLTYLCAARKKSDFIYFTKLETGKSVNKDLIALKLNFCTHCNKYATVKYLLHVCIILMDLKWAKHFKRSTRLQIKRLSRQYVKSTII